MAAELSAIRGWYEHVTHRNNTLSHVSLHISALGLCGFVAMHQRALLKMLYLILGNHYMSMREDRHHRSYSQ